MSTNNHPSYKEVVVENGRTSIELPPWHSVESSVLKAVRYTSAFRALDISFVSGRVYRFLNVSGAMWEALLTASSKGRWFGKELRPYSETYPCFELVEEESNQL